MGLRAPAFTSSCMADAASQSVLSSLLMRMNWGTSERGDRGATRMPGDTAGSAAGRRRGGGGGLCVCEGSGGEGERRRSRKHPSPTRKTAAPTPLPHLSCRLPRRCCKGGREGGGGGGGGEQGHGQTLRARASHSDAEASAAASTTGLPPTTLYAQEQHLLVRTWQHPSRAAARWWCHLPLAQRRAARHWPRIQTAACPRWRSLHPPPAPGPPGWCCSPASSSRSPDPACGH